MINHFLTIFNWQIKIIALELHALFLQYFFSFASYFKI